MTQAQSLGCVREILFISIVLCQIQIFTLQSQARVAPSFLIPLNSLCGIRLPTTFDPIPLHLLKFCSFVPGHGLLDIDMGWFSLKSILKLCPILQFLILHEPFKP